MPAFVVITSGITAGHRQWIESPVLRVGSDSSCGVVVPSLELAPHAGTLEYRSGQYFVYNKSLHAQTVGQTELKPMGSCVWQPGQVWLLASDATLMLEVEGDPAPCREQVDTLPSVLEEEDDDSYPAEKADDQETEAKPSLNTGQLIQVGVIILCVIGSVALLMQDQLKDKTPRADLPTLKEIVDQSQAGLPNETRMLQYAMAMKLRDRPEDAKRWFYELRDRLLVRQATLRQQNEPDSIPMLDFTLAQLEQVE
ncbi:hypothetical protein LOC68_09560 [Blastopirellula sp. JC732]|uniref:FHA domain-containing protein n=1 Tax=Blastopirellula sediminis TaxID=2894196 RepID=A0A9X1ML04_9BACT|nr:FHA domain-containing protein [Blastopirellula sediminis]MCC9608579.1 hypothetical protein [Blastopirellula sediminis]MCC9628644.1 hypothetical protein [Blastopirellula sediminis]